jgi:hypothetical protein
VTANASDSVAARDEARQLYRRERLSHLVADARRPLAPYFEALDDDEILNRLDRTVAIYDELLSARTRLQKEIASGVQTGTAEQAADLRQVCEELNSAVANALMYGEVAAERNLLTAA